MMILQSAMMETVAQKMFVIGTQGEEPVSAEPFRIVPAKEKQKLKARDVFSETAQTRLIAE